MYFVANNFLNLYSYGELHLLILKRYGAQRPADKEINFLTKAENIWRMISVVLLY